MAACVASEKGFKNMKQRGLEASVSSRLNVTGRKVVTLHASVEGVEGILLQCLKYCIVSVQLFCNLSVLKVRGDYAACALSSRP